MLAARGVTFGVAAKRRRIHLGLRQQMDNDPKISQCCRFQLNRRLVKFQQRYQKSHRACDFCIVWCSLDTDSLDSLLIRLFDRVQLFLAHFEQLFFANLFFDRVEEYPDNHTFIEALWPKMPIILVLQITGSEDLLSP